MISETSIAAGSADADTRDADVDEHGADDGANESSGSDDRAGRGFAARTEHEPEAGPRRRTAAGVRRAALKQTIEREIIPRLVLLHGGRSADAGAVEPCAAAATADDAPVAAIDPTRFEALVAALLAAEDGPSRIAVDTLLADGAAVEDVLLGVLAPAARRLGRLWETDAVDFVAVTEGLCRLHELARRVGGATREDRGDARTAEAASRPALLLAPAPGEQHVFGLIVLAELFRRAGWRVHEERSTTPGELAAAVSARRYDVVGLSAASPRGFDRLALAIRAVRRSSANARIGVMVGGRAFHGRPDLAARVGADATADDAREAIARATALRARAV